jgi:hypothetical protein
LKFPTVSKKKKKDNKNKDPVYDDLEHLKEQAIVLKRLSKFAGYQSFEDSLRSRKGKSKSSFSPKDLPEAEKLNIASLKGLKNAILLRKLR